jgi:hypothetical protein
MLLAELSKFELDIGNQSPDSEDSDGDVIFIEQQVESTGNQEPVINSQDNLRQIHDANSSEPPDVSSFVSQLSDEDSQEEEKDDFRKSTIIFRRKLIWFHMQMSKLTIRLSIDLSSQFSHWFYLPILHRI